MLLDSAEGKLGPNEPNLAHQIVYDPTGIIDIAAHTDVEQSASGNPGRGHGGIVRIVELQRRGFGCVGYTIARGLGWERNIVYLAIAIADELGAEGDVAYYHRRVPDIPNIKGKGEICR
jgi:hypothetical protein